MSSPQRGNAQRLHQEKGIAPELNVDRVQMAQNVLCFTVWIVGKWFDKGSLVSEAWRKEHQGEHEEQSEGPSERIETTEEWKEWLHLDLVLGAVCWS